jgi:hypothetical protein
MLLQDLVEETSASNRRAADRLAAEAQYLDQRRAMVALEELRQMAVESAQQASAYALARLPQAEGVWRLALAALRHKPTGEDAERLLRSLLAVFESGQRLMKAPGELWEMARQLGAVVEQLDMLDKAEMRLEELATEARQALEFRSRNRQPADPARLALGLQMAQEGKTVKADEARAWFRRG